MEPPDAVRHTVPMTFNVCLWIAASFCPEGLGLMGVGVVVQQQLGLRPSEMLELEAVGIALPDESQGAIVVGLGCGLAPR